MSAPIPERDERVQAHIAQSRLLKEVAEAEPMMMRGLIEEAFLCEDGGRHWQDYERLKKQAQTFVGWDAPDTRLRDEAHYTVMMGFIDWLLPDVIDPETEELPTNRWIRGTVIDAPREPRQIRGWQSLGDIVREMNEEGEW